MTSMTLGTYGTGTGMTLTCMKHFPTTRAANASNTLNFLCVTGRSMYLVPVWFSLLFLSTVFYGIDIIWSQQSCCCRCRPFLSCGTLLVLLRLKVFAAHRPIVVLQQREKGDRGARKIQKLQPKLLLIEL